MISIPFILNYNQSLKKNVNTPYKRRTMSDEYFNQKMYILKKLNPEVFSNKNNLLFKSKSPFLKVFESNINRLKVQIENKSGSALVKNNTAAKTFDNIIHKKQEEKFYMKQVKKKVIQEFFILNFMFMN